jgi:hypothetical protein
MPGEDLRSLLGEHAGSFALLGVRYLLLVVAAVAIMRLCRRAGHGWAWTLLPLVPIVLCPFAFGSILLGIVAVEEEEWVMTLSLAILPAMLVRLAFRRWPTDSKAQLVPAKPHQG